MKALFRKLFGTGRRFRICVKAKDWNGHQGVTLTLFHKDGLPAELYDRIIPKNLHEREHDGHPASVADEPSSRQEVTLLRRWFGRYENFRFEARLAEPI